MGSQQFAIVSGTFHVVMNGSHLVKLALYKHSCCYIQTILKRMMCHNVNSDLAHVRGRALDWIEKSRVAQHMPTACSEPPSTSLSSLEPTHGHGQGDYSRYDTYGSTK